MRPGTFKGPEPPFVGAVYQATTKSGRRWEACLQVGDLWRLRPMGDDVGGFGGVKALNVTTARLRDRKHWRMVGVTTRSLP